MKRVISIIISGLIIVFSIVGVLVINSHTIEGDPIAQNGAMDLTDDEESKLISLDGRWEFYPGIFIFPAGPDSLDGSEAYAADEGNPFTIHENIKRYVKVPGDWGEAMDSRESSNSSGTYRLIINVPQEGQFGIKTSTIRTSARIYMNGKEVVLLGNPSLDRSDFIPASRYKTGFAESIDSKIELVVQVSSYDYRAGGILKSIKFGSYNAIMDQNNKSRAVDVLMASVTLASALYFFLQWLQRRDELYLLYFGGAVFFMSVYLSTMDEQIITMVWDYGFFTRIRLQIAMMIMVTFCFLKFVQYFFKESYKTKISKALSGMLLGLLLFVFNDLDRPWTVPMGVMQSFIAVGLVVSYCYILWVLLRTMYINSEFADYILVITASIFSYWIVIIMKMLFEFEISHIPSVLIIFVMLGISMMMTERLELDHRKVKQFADRLVLSDNMKDSFLARTSHELRTPIHVITNLTKLILEGRKGSLNFSQQEDLIFIYNESKRLARLVDDLLDASSIEKGRVKIRLESVDLNYVVEGLVGEMKMLIAENKQIKILNQIPVNFPPINADTDRFKQIIYNLLHNAIKFTDAGRITITASSKGEQAEIRIADTGTGIGKNHIENIFDSHYKENEKINEDGFGLGLTVVKHLVEIHGGTIGVESVKGEGTCFYFTIPFYEQGGEVAGAKKDDFPPAVMEGRGYNRVEGNTEYTILIVDDEPSNQKVLLDIIKQMGHNALSAGKGEQVMPILSKNSVDLIILDIMLPDMSGDLVCKNIRKEYSMSELPVLILTASGRISDLMKSFEYGANDFQMKPADGDELISRIQSLLLMKESAKEGMRKEFQYFYSQISPHFLYNTLNTIIGLSYKDIENARTALFNLSIYLRGKMNLYQQKSFISLESELELITAYLEIEKMRYMDRLKLEFDIEDGVSAMIPPLTLQPLVENSIHHCMVGDNEITIRISAKRAKDGLISITVGDNGPGIPLEMQRRLLSGENKRLGFTNVMKKINMQKRSSIAIESEPGKGTLVMILVPEVEYESCFD